MTKTKIKLSKLDRAVLKCIKTTMENYVNYSGHYCREENLEMIQLYKENTTPIFCKELMVFWLKQCHLYPFNKICNETFWDMLVELMAVGFEEVNWEIISNMLEKQNEIKNLIVTLTKEVKNEN